MTGRVGKIGFLINPIAGMGGAVGLKGTDGLAAEALARGAKPLAAMRARSCLQMLSLAKEDILFYSASGEMGEDELRQSYLQYEIVYRAEERSSTQDTKKACQTFLKNNVDLILFCGGDGTARDIAEIAGKLPMLGIPAGVKMHSGVFAISPQAAAELAIGFIKGQLNARETEIVDVDEELYRAGELQTRLYAVARTPYMPTLVQERKRIYSSANEDDFKEQIALFATEFMRDGSAYILGAGTTTAMIAEKLGVDKTLLGVDVLKNGKLLLKDASERDLRAMLEKEKAVKIILSPIGAQGFILGRGSQQISAAIIKRVGEENLIIISTPHKLAEIPRLLVDTGDIQLDEILAGKRLVVTGYHIAQRKETAAASMLNI